MAEDIFKEIWEGWQERGGPECCGDVELALMVCTSFIVQALTNLQKEIREKS